MAKSTMKFFGTLLVLVSALTIFVLPTHAASVYCSNCNQYMLYCCDTFDYETYYRYCDNAKNTWHEHIIETVYNDYVCMSCGDVKTLYSSQTEYCQYGNMSRSNCP